MIDGGEGIDKSILALVFVYAVQMHASQSRQIRHTITLNAHTHIYLFIIFVVMSNITTH